MAEWSFLLSNSLIPVLKKKTPCVRNCMHQEEFSWWQELHHAEVLVAQPHGAICRSHSHHWEVILSSIYNKYKFNCVSWVFKTCFVLNMNILFMSYLRTEWVSLRFLQRSVWSLRTEPSCSSVNNTWFNVCVICILAKHLYLVLRQGLFWHHESLLELSGSSIWIQCRMEIGCTGEHFSGFQHSSIMWTNSFKKP